MQINSIQNTPSFGIKVPRNLAQKIKKQVPGTILSDNASAIAKSLRKTGSDATELEAFNVISLTSPSKGKDSFLFRILMQLKTGIPSDKKTIYKTINFSKFPPSNIDVVLSDIAFSVNHAERYYISTKMLSDIGKNYRQSGFKFNLSALNESADRLSEYYGKRQGEHIQSQKKLLLPCFTRK